MTAAQLDWSALGAALRQSAMDVHDGKLPDVGVAYSFLRDNPECFLGEDTTWHMPAEPPLAFRLAYHHANPDYVPPADPA